MASHKAPDPDSEFMRAEARLIDYDEGPCWIDAPGQGIDLALDAQDFESDFTLAVARSLLL